MTGLRPVILRPGFITREMIEGVIGTPGDEAIPEASEVSGDIVPKAPGMKYRHYAPVADLTVVRGDEEEVEKKIDEWLEGLGYVREGSYYRHIAEEEQHKTIALFCHFGISMAVLGILTDCSPLVLWHRNLLYCLSLTKITEW